MLGFPSVPVSTSALQSHSVDYPRFAEKRRLGSTARRVAIVLAILWTSPLLPTRAAEPEPLTPPVAEETRGASRLDDPNADTVPELTEAEATELVDRLASGKFAEREAAMGEILRLGPVMTPYLRRAIESRRDPELVLRAEVTLSQMTVDDLQSRIETFLSLAPGTDEQAREWFAGWEPFELAMGDSLATRELFISILKAHPDVIESLALTTFERAAAAEQAAVSIQVAMLQKRQPPTLADAVAMLLPLTDPAVQVAGAYETQLLSVFNRQYGPLRQDAQLWQPISAMLQRWVLQSRFENRIDVLWYAMQWDLPAGGELGLRTLKETQDIETLQTALQAIARFGTPDDSSKLIPLLADDRVADSRMPVLHNSRPLRVTVADAALTAAAILHGVPVKELGMPAPVLHPKVGFLTEHSGYTVEQAETRDEAIARAIRWCEGESPAKPASRPAKPAPR